MSLNPIDVTQQLHKALVTYLTTTFDINRDDKHPELAAEVRSVFERPNQLINGPYLELALPYIRGASLDELIEEGVITPKLRELPCFKKGVPLPLNAPLYLHQEQAIRRIVQDKRGVVVSSGTGSGKTESFLIPLLHDLLTDTTKGVRAVLIYPLNALVNDQLDRLRVILKDSDITFGRYTSELAQTAAEAERHYGDDRLPNEIISREELRGGRIPQILITNYAMLEYLLLRPEDSILFDSGAWRFIILDEAHTYTGAQGVEVAMLLRRLKVRLRKSKGEMRCVATSATLVNDSVQDAVNFATNLFGEDYEPDDIIFGRVDHAFPAPVNVPADSDAHRQHRYLEVDAAQIAEQIHESSPSELLKSIEPIIPPDAHEALARYPTAADALYQVMSGDPYLHKLRAYLIENEASPVLVSEAAKHVFDQLPEMQALEALFRLIALGAAAQVKDQAPLLPARYHVFARAPQGLWVCLNRNCPGRDHARKDNHHWSVLYSSPHQTCSFCDARVYPLAICRTCGQVYIYGKSTEDDSLHPEVSPYPDDRHLYFVMNEVVEDLSLGEDMEQVEVSHTKQGQLKVGQPVTLCLKCGRTARCRCQDAPKVELFPVQSQSTNKNRTQLSPVPKLEECLRCGDSSLKDSEIATPVTVAGNTPISVLAQELYRLLPTNAKASDLPGEGRKLLTFYDSRQGAARFAAFLQDVYNDVLYRYLILDVVRTLQSEKNYSPDLDTLAKRCIQVGWKDLRVFQNDLDFLDQTNLDPTKYQLNRNETEKLLQLVQARILAEITTKRSSRQSLESLGLLKVDYFESAESIPDMTALKQATGLSDDQLLLLIRQLLDSLRRNKVVEMPPDVQYNDRVFGRFETHPTVSQKAQHTSELPWIGTNRHSRYRLIERALRYAGLAASEEDVQRVGRTLWDWLLEVADIMQPSGKGCYRIRHTCLFFSYPEEGWGRCNRCQRLAHHATALPCAHINCGGTIQPIAGVDHVQAQNYYFSLYNRKPIPMRVEEHTAQLTPDHGREYQDLFKNGRINVLSCSTTFEMGIDLGDLQAVLLSNVPPTVANYRQRAGRAGRRSGGAAYILTWSQERPHDQIYFSDPKQIIRGEVRVPQLLLDNEHIRHRHVNAVLFSAFVRYLRRQSADAKLDEMGAFFDLQSATPPHIKQLDAWLSEDRADLVRNFWQTLHHTGDPQLALKQFRNRMLQEAERYQRIIEEYRKLESEASQKREHRSAEDFKKQAERFAKRRVIDSLSDHGVLPSYSFPLYSVELTLSPKFEKQINNLRLQRDLRDAIREYAPGAEVVADKRIWRSGGIIFEKNTPQRFQFRHCDTCQFVVVADSSGIEISDTHCRVCGEPYGNKKEEYLQPDGFRIDSSKSGKPAGQYVNRPQAKMFSALLTEGTSDLKYWGSPPLVGTSYSREEKLFYVNEGAGSGFRICMKCGCEVGAKDKVCKNKLYGQECGGTDIQDVKLGHTIETDTLRLQFENSQYVHVSGTDETFWYTLLYALLQGASKALQIERRDIDGLLYPVKQGTSWHYSLVLYDSVPGGAGHVKAIENNLERVVRQAYEIISTCECAPETSCIRCLRDYYNQQHYSKLQRGRIEPYLLALLSSLEKRNGLVAINQPRWLAQKLNEAQRSIILAAHSLGEAELTAYGYQTWLDLLIVALRRGVDVTLILQALPAADGASDAIVLRDKLRVGMSTGSGLKLYLATAIPTWKAMIDDAISIQLDGPMHLDGDGHRWQLFVGDKTSTPTALSELQRAMQRPITKADLELPPNTRVYDIGNRHVANLMELDAFKDFYKSPITSLAVYDPYLIDEERLIHRLGDHIRLAQQHDSLQQVQVHTADANYKSGHRSEQARAIEELKRRFGDLVEVKRDYKEHDRFLIATRADGSKSRMIIGRGLDFFRNGRTAPTYIIIEDPWKRR